MSEWWTYRLSSFLLFSPRTYFHLHELYNAEIWPAQLVALAFGIVLATLAFRGGRRSGRTIAFILAGCWAFVGWAYHVQRYATINWAAVYFGGAFLAEALLLAALGVVREPLTVESTPPARRIGAWMMLFALIVQPAIGLLAGRPLTQAACFGIAPDPTVTGTLGMLLVARRPPWVLMIIPLLWCVISGAFEWAMRAPDALLMPLVGAIAAGAVAMSRATSPARQRR
jgi:hypothetical protein